MSLSGSRDLIKVFQESLSSDSLYMIESSELGDIMEVEVFLYYFNVYVEKHYDFDPYKMYILLSKQHKIAVSSFTQEHYDIDYINRKIHEFSIYAYRRALDVYFNLPEKDRLFSLDKKNKKTSA